MKKLAQLGRPRDESDGFRRYLPVAMRFDTRAHILNTTVEDDWEPQVREQWFQNQRYIREDILHEFGVKDGERKIGDFAALGHAPWSVIAPHNELLTDSRRAFIFGSYYSALLGTVGLAERILNDLVLTLRDSHAEHPATKEVATKKSFDDWSRVIRVLLAWGVLDEEHAAHYRRLAKIRNDAVHYRSDRALLVRTSGLEAMELISTIISHIFAPLGGPPRFISGTVGNSFISLAAEADPLVQQYYVPSSVLVSPDFEFRSNLQEVWDEQDYGTIHGVAALSDDEFVVHLSQSRRSTA